MVPRLFRRRRPRRSAPTCVLLASSSNCWPRAGRRSLRNPRLVSAPMPTCAARPITTETPETIMHHANLEKLKSLRLFGMARALQELHGLDERGRLDFDDQLALLIEREATDRANAALETRL